MTQRVSIIAAALLLLTSASSETGAAQERFHEEPLDFLALEHLAESPAIAAALESPARLLELLVSPQTPFLERMIAAHVAGPTFPMSSVRTIWSAAEALDDASTRAGFWRVGPHPLSAAARMQPEVVEEQVVVLGHTFATPEFEIPYPMTIDEKSRAPWPWQAQQALRLLDERLLGPSPPHDPAWRHAAHRARNREWLENTFQLPCGNVQEAHRVSQRARRVADTHPLSYLSLLKNLALDPSLESPSWAGGLIHFCRFQTAKPADSDRREQACAALAYELLEDGTVPSTRDAILSGIGYLQPLHPLVALRAGRILRDDPTISSLQKAWYVESLRAGHEGREPRVPSEPTNVEDVSGILEDHVSWFERVEPQLELRSSSAPLPESSTLLPAVSQCTARH